MCVTYHVPVIFGIVPTKVFSLRKRPGAARRPRKWSDFEDVWIFFNQLPQPGTGEDSESKSKAGTSSEAVRYASLRPTTIFREFHGRHARAHSILLNVASNAAWHLFWQHIGWFYVLWQAWATKSSMRSFKQLSTMLHPHDTGLYFGPRFPFFLFLHFHKPRILSKHVSCLNGIGKAALHPTKRVQ